MSGIKTAFKYGFMASAAAIGTVFLTAEAFASDAKNADGPAGSYGDQVAKFRQLGTELPTPNIFRNASGAPGPAYWQQQANVDIDAALDEDDKRIIATMEIDYVNNSPDKLNYIWLALDQNRFKDGSLARESTIASAAGSRRGDGNGRADRVSFGTMRYHQAMEDREYGFEFKAVTNADGEDLPYIINDSMMRIDLPEGLSPDERFAFKIDWEHNIIDEEAVGGRGGYECFTDKDEDGNCIFGLAQWFPRMAAYTDYTGWQNKQFLGRGEFTLEFGNYNVNLTVPSDHIVAATGVLQNPRQVMTAKQRKRMDEANSQKPVFIVTPEEAEKNEESKATGTKTWRFKAENVRDFAWSSSRKYIWDAMIHEQEDDKNPVVTAMSFYPKEANPIWSQYSTQAVVHTMDVYSKFSFPYPYPTAQSVNSWERGGMEYPMITFNGYRPYEDEKSDETVYSRGVKYGLIGVIIHEIGHIYFPMVVNSDERRWTWMDEGLNSFLEYLAEYEWEENFPITRNGKQNPLDDITRYMTSSNQVPIMTQSDSVLQFGPNAYSKPAASLIVLRETVMGRELFDFAFKEYAKRWKFKRPTPADFFRTMEDASAVDLDWFWRGWYFGTDHVDMGISDMREYTLSTQDPEEEFDKDRADDLETYPENITQRRNREEGLTTRLERFDDLKDFYNENDKFTITNKDRNSFKKFVDGLEGWEKETWERAQEDGNYFYFVDFKNHGGLISPLPLKLTYANGETEEMMVPAEIWRRNSESVTKLIIRKKRIKSIELDPAHQTADADYSNNSFPPVMTPSRLKLYKSDFKQKSMMANMLVELKSEDSKNSPEDNGKDMPMSHGSDSDAESLKKGSSKKEGNRKDTPMSHGSGSDEESLKKSDSKKPKSHDATKMEKKVTSKETKSHKAESKNDGEADDADNTREDIEEDVKPNKSTDKNKSSLRRTLEKMMGKK